MSIRWDSILVRGLARAIRDRLTDARLRAVALDHAARTARLFFREATLAFHLHPDQGSALFLEPMEPGSDARPLPARLMDATVRPDDRVLTLHLRRVRGRPPRLDLVVELMTNQWNAAVVDQETGVIRRLLWTREAGDRVLRRGAVYAPPPPSDREGAEEPVSEARWTELLGSVPPEQRRQVLLRSVAYTSPVNAGPILDAGLPAGYALWRRLRDEEIAAPCVLLLPRGPQPYPHALPGVDAEAAPDLPAAFAAAYERAGTEEAPATGIAPSLLRALEGEVNRALGRVRQLERQLERAPEAAELRAAGDLLLARMSRVRSGLRDVELEGFDGGTVRLTLDPARSPAENASDYYRRAARAERAAARVPGLLSDARARAAELEALLDRARAGEADEEELLGRVRLPEPGGKEPEDRGPVLPYRRFRSSGGLEIRVGRGARWNDDLTFRHSAPDDVWLHARHAAGAHVILRWPHDENPPARDLEEAAVLAALHSKARTSGSVPVDWTRRKHVRKPRKAPPGTVRLDRARTLFVEPDPGVAVALEEEG